MSKLTAIEQAMQWEHLNGIKLSMADRRRVLQEGVFSRAPTEQSDKSNSRRGKNATRWLWALDDCAELLQKGFEKQAKAMAKRAMELEAAYPAEVKAERDSWNV